jgi:hypothetical protein
VLAHLEADKLVLVEHGAMHGFSVPLPVFILEYLEENLQHHLHLFPISMNDRRYSVVNTVMLMDTMDSYIGFH